MIVVSDATPFSNLIQIDRLDLLHRLFGTVYMPRSVRGELEALVDFNYPITKLLDTSWIVVEDVNQSSLLVQLQERLDIGEADAIAMAIAKQADRILIDEIAGRTVAKAKKLQVIGTLGVLLEARKRGLIFDVKMEMDNLRAIGFWISSSLYDQVVELEHRIS